MCVYYIRMSLENSCANPAFPIPTGCIMPYMGLEKFIPPTFLVCDGRVLKQTDYPELYKILTNQFNGTAVVAAGYFKIPSLNNALTQLIPNGVLKTDPTQIGARLPPSLHSSDPIPAIVAANIPQMTGSNFSQTYPTDQVGIVGRTFNARGDYSDSRYEATDSTGANNPKIVALNSSSETGGAGSMNSANYLFKNPAPTALGTITLNDSHTVQYGGMTCIMIIKAFSSYGQYASKNAAIVQQAEQAAALVASNLARKTGIEVATGVADAQNDQSAANEAAAIAAAPTGGGTLYTFANVPQLEGFRMPPNNN